MPRATLTYALAWAKSGGCAGQITIIETACDRCQREGEQHASWRAPPCMVAPRRFGLLTHTL